MKKFFLLLLLGMMFVGCSNHDLHYHARIKILENNTTAVLCHDFPQHYHFGDSLWVRPISETTWVVDDTASNTMRAVIEELEY